jgi:hypothetical protein
MEWQSASEANQALKRAAKEERLKCPACGEIYTGATTSIDFFITCPACAYDASGDVWLDTSSGPLRQGQSDTAPPETEIQYSESGGTRIWDIPPNGKSGCFLAFSVVWLGFISLFTTILVNDSLNHGSHQSRESIGLRFLFMIPFWFVALGMLYLALRERNARYRITIDDLQITLIRNWSGRIKKKSILLDQIQYIHQVVFYTRNYQPVYGIEIKSRSIKLRFGSSLSADEKAWLIAGLKQACDGKLPTRSTFSAPALVSRPSPANVLPSATGMTADSNAPSYQAPLPPFRVELPRTKVLLVIAIMVLLGELMFFSGLLKNQMFSSFDDFSKWVCGLIIPLVMFTPGLCFFIYALNIVSKKITLEGNGSELFLRTTRFGRILSEQRFPYEQVRGLRTVSNGHVNEQPRYRLVLLAGGKSHTLKSYLSGEKCTEIINAVHRGLGLAHDD